MWKLNYSNVPILPGVILVISVLLEEQPFPPYFHGMDLTPFLTVSQVLEQTWLLPHSLTSPGAGLTPSSQSHESWSRPAASTGSLPTLRHRPGQDQQHSLAPRLDCHLPVLTERPLTPEAHSEWDVPRRDP